MMDGEVDEEALKVVEELMKQQQIAMTEAHRTLTADIMRQLAVGPKKAQVTKTSLWKIRVRAKPRTGRDGGGVLAPVWCVAAIPAVVLSSLCPRRSPLFACGHCVCPAVCRSWRVSVVIARWTRQAWPQVSELLEHSLWHSLGMEF